MSFSAGLKLTGLDDFIAPSQACIKPVENLAASKGSGGVISIQLEIDGSYSELGGTGGKVKLAPAKITLNDCLACNGCITSAESVLITQQSVDELLSVLQHPSAPPVPLDAPAPAKNLHLVVSVAPQCWASIAAHLNISGGEALGVISALFRALGAVAVLDIAVAREISLIETSAHFESIYLAQQAASGGARAGHGHKPVLASACPGWICYAEKREHGALPIISPVKSPQQIAGTLVKRMWGKARGLLPADIYHVCVMPCFDKKLEASRPEFRVGSGGLSAESSESSRLLSASVEVDVREVDLVLSSSELLELAAKVLPGGGLRELGRAPIETVWGSSVDAATLAVEPQWGTVSGSAGSIGSGAGSSGGFAKYVFEHVAKHVYGRQVKGRNSDMHELELPGTPLKVARCYGFRNIQNITRQLKSPKGCAYDFVEVMACPSGCINGGGQVRVSEGQVGAAADGRPDLGGETPKERLARVVHLFSMGQRERDPWQSSDASAVYASFVQGAPNSREAISLFHTSYKAAEDVSALNPIGIKW